MSPLAYIRQQLAVARINRALKKERHWAWELSDAINAQSHALKVSRARIAQLEAQLLAIEPPDDIVRRSGAGA